MRLQAQYLLGVEVFVVFQEAVPAHALMGLCADHLQRLQHFLQHVSTVVVGVRRRGREIDSVGWVSTFSQVGDMPNAVWRA